MQLLNCYSLPSKNRIPDWKLMLHEAKLEQESLIVHDNNDIKNTPQFRLAVIATLLVMILALLIARRNRES